MSPWNKIPPPELAQRSLGLIRDHKCHIDME